MFLSLSLVEISLWLAVTSIILLATSELISSYSGKTTVLIKKRRLRAVALIVGFLFVFTVFIQIYEVIIVSLVRS